MICRWLKNGQPVEAPADESIFTEHIPLIVVGVGTAGAYAVLAAAKQGLAVLGIDCNSGAGGMGTYGYVSGYYYGAAGGLHVAIDRQAEQLCDALFVDTVEAKRYLVEKEALRHGARLRFEARLIGVFLEGTTVRGIRFLADGQLHAVSCDIAIDATAEADLCRMAGCALLGGRSSDGKMRPFTSVKVWLNEDGQIARTNHDSGYIDPYDDSAVTCGILQAHASQLLPEFHLQRGKTLFLVPQIGIREGMRIEAEKTLDMAGILDGQLAPDPLFHAYADFDKHGKDNALESDTMLDWTVACNLSTVCAAVPVPASALVPHGFRSLLVAGRHLGVDHDVASLVRMKRDMHRCGESAGTLAALAIRRGCQPLDVPYAEVQPLLLATGCLNPAHAVGLRFDDKERRDSVRPLTDLDALREALASDMPGIALFTCRQNRSEPIRAALRQWLADPDPLLSGNCALALGLQADPACLPVLRRIIRDRDSFYYKDCRRTNQLRSAIAIYLAGKLGDIEVLPLLETILCDQAEFDRPLYHDIRETSYKFNPTQNFNQVYFQIVSHAAMAVQRVMDLRPELRERGHRILREAFASDRHLRLTTSMPPGTYEYAQMDNIRQVVLAEAL